MAAFTESDWTYYRILTIDNTKVAATMPDGGESGFPVDLIIDPPNGINDDTGDLATTFFDNYADTGDLCFTANPPGANTLAHGIKRVVTTNGSEYLAAAVYIPSIAGAVDTTIRMYYTSILGDQQDKTGVYPVADGWEAHWSLEETLGGATGATIYLDWTSNANDGDDYVSATGKTGIGKIALSQEFDGIDDYIVVADSASLDVTAITIAGWVNFDVGGAFAYMVAKCEDVDLQDAYRLYKDTADRLIWSLNPWASETSIGAVPIATPFRFAVTYDGAGTYIMYVNGAVFASDGLGAKLDAIAPTTSRLTLGARYDFSDSVYELFLDGDMDELSISDLVRSANWELTTFNCQDDNDAFWTMGVETPTFVAGYVGMQMLLRELEQKMQLEELGPKMILSELEEKYKLERW